MKIHELNKGDTFNAYDVKGKPIRLTFDRMDGMYAIVYLGKDMLNVYATANLEVGPDGNLWLK